MGRPKGSKRGLKQARLKEHKVQAMWDSNLVILQANVMRCPKRLKHIFRHALCTSDRVPDIVAVQDPPWKVPWLGSYPYEVDFCPDRPLLEGDNPDEQKDPTKHVPLAGVCFYVHKSIPKERWNVIYHDNDNKKLSATLHLSTPSGQVAIHNVYNLEKRVNIDQLIDETTASRRNIIVGDFNLHHRQWSGRILRPFANCSKANRLHDGMLAAKMQCVTKAGTVTYTHSKGARKKMSCIDLTFVSEEQAPRVLSCAVKKIASWDESDHRPVQTVLDIGVFRDETKRFLWKKTPKKRYLTAMADALAQLQCLELETREQVDTQAAAIRDTVLRTMEECVPVRPAFSVKPAARPPSAAARSALKNEGVPTVTSNPRKGRGWTRFWKRWADRVIGDERKEKVESWRRFVPEKANNTRGVFQMARLAKRVCQPKDKARIPTLVDNGVTYSTEVEKGSCLRNSMWPETSDGESAPELPPPDMGLSSSEYEADQSLDEEEVDRLIRALPTGKAAGEDGIANEAIKMARVPLVPVLTKLFQACLKLSHHPDIFKHAITVILPKEGKDKYSEPKSWRPIALLPSLGKLLEKIMADRLKDLAMKHSLLPGSQYGAAGKSTAHAVQDLLYPVYEAWTRKQKRRIRRKMVRMMRKATLMGLDISSAFDRIGRSKLLEILVQKRLPRWIVMFVWSFLSNRSTVLKMPGSTTDQFFVNIGIPQGSRTQPVPRFSRRTVANIGVAISPILFLFFAAPILEQINKTTHSSVTIYAFAYVDDTYLLAVSNSYEENCKRLEQVHNDILSWAGPAGVSFSPHKYNVMHFKHPASKEPDCQLLPRIPGLTNTEGCLKTSLKILGVIVDHQLGWEKHIEEVSHQHGCLRLSSELTAYPRSRRR